MSEQHLSFDELAELAEGLLGRRQARTATDHLATCEECATRAATLDAAAAALHGLGPVSIPADVAARLDRALAGAGQQSAEDTVVPDLTQVRQRRRVNPAWAGAAAAAVVLIASVSAILATRGGHHPSTNAGASAGPAPLVATTARQPLLSEDTGRTYTPTSLAALAPSLVTSGLTAGTPVGAANGAGSAPVPDSGQAPIAPAPTAASVHKNSVAQPPADAARSGSSFSQQFSAVGLVPAPLRPYVNSPQKLLACAAFITDTPGAAPLAVDYARWSNPQAHLRHVPALVLVFTDPQDSSEIDVYVVAPACDDSSLLDFQLLSAS